MEIPNTEAPEDTEFTVTHGNYKLTVAPYGASLRALSGRAPDGAWKPLATGYHGAANKAGGQGDVLIPFPGRIASGHYRFNGRDHQLDKTDHEAPNAIHGFLRHKQWIAADDDRSVTFTTTIRDHEFVGYPYSLTVELKYRLNEKGLTAQFTITNVGDQTAPVAAGFHPYFTVGSAFIDSDSLNCPFDSYLEYNQHLIPTGRVISVDGTPFDFRERRTIGSVKFNTCYLSGRPDADGRKRITLAEPSDKHAVTVWMDEAFGYVVLYSGDPLPESQRRRSLAIEPMTCASDGFNHAEWGLLSLAPGESTSGAWGVETRWE